MSEFEKSLIYEAITAQRDAAVKEERAACKKILDDAADYNAGENEEGYVNSEAEDMCRYLANKISQRGQS